MRLALGATRTRIVRLLIVENLVLAVPGALLGVLLAQHGIPLLVGVRRAARRAASASSSTSSVDGLVIGFAVLVACGSALVFGFVPGAAELAGRSGVGHQRRRVAARRGARTAARGPRRRAGGGVAAAAGRRRPGDAQPRRGAARESRLRREPRDGDRARRQTERLRRGARPRVLSPAAGRGARRRRHRIGHARRVHAAGVSRHAARSAWRSRATSRAAAKTWRSCRTPSVPTTSARCGSACVAGREFEDRDDETAAPVAIVNNTLAQRFWGGAANAIGKRIRVARRRLADGGRRGGGREVLADQRSRRGRTSTCRSCSRTGRA